MSDIGLQRQLERSLERVRNLKKELELMGTTVVGKRWRTATVVAIDMMADAEAELEAFVFFLTRNDGEKSGEVLRLSTQGVVAMMQKLGAKRVSELVGKACIICVESDGTTVTAVDHFFAKNPVGENG